MKKINWGSWNLWRSTRMIAGLAFIIFGIYNYDLVVAAAGLFLVIHAYINACAACANGSCEIPQTIENGKV